MIIIWFDFRISRANAVGRKAETKTGTQPSQPTYAQQLTVARLTALIFTGTDPRGPAPPPALRSHWPTPVRTPPFSSDRGRSQTPPAPPPPLLPIFSFPSFSYSYDFLFTDSHGSGAPQSVSRLQLISIQSIAIELT